MHLPPLNRLLCFNHISTQSNMSVSIPEDKNNTNEMDTVRNKYDKSINSLITHANRLTLILFAYSRNAINSITKCDHTYLFLLVRSTELSLKPVNSIFVEHECLSKHVIRDGRV